MAIPASRILPWAGLAARLLVGGVWLVAGALKIGDLPASVRAVRAYQLLPEAIVPAVGYGLPLFELILGTLLVVGLVTRLSAVLSALLQIAFLIGIISAWSRGLQIDCGCFGGGGFVADAAQRYPWEVARDVGLLLLSLILVVRPVTALSLDRWLLGEQRGDAAEQPDEGPDEGTATRAGSHPDGAAERFTE